MLIQTALPNLQQLALLVLELPEVVLATERANLQHSLELGKLLEDLFEVSLVQRVDLADRLGPRHILVLVLQLEDETDVAEVTAGLERHQVVRLKVLVRHVDDTLLDEVDA